MKNSALGIEDHWTLRLPFVAASEREPDFVRSHEAEGAQPALAEPTQSIAGQEDTLSMTRLAAGHDAELNELMERHAEKLFHYLVRSLQNEGDAADLVQETFVRVYQNRTKFDSRKKFSAWLYTIASNLVRSRYRWRRRHPQVSLDAENEATGNNFGESLAEQGASPSETIQIHERAAAVRRAVAALPEQFRVPLILSEYEEKSHTEIGEILRCSAKAIEGRVARAREQLRASLRHLLQTNPLSAIESLTQTG